MPKSAEQRAAEGNPAHRPLPAPRPVFPAGTPERPRGMSAKARQAWDEYVERMVPLNILRSVDGFALRRLCEDLAELQELQSGRRKLLSQMRRDSKTRGEKISGGAAVALAQSTEGRRLALEISQLQGRIYRLELQFGLTPVAATRLESAGGAPVIPFPASTAHVSIESALCG